MPESGGNDGANHSSRTSAGTVTTQEQGAGAGAQSSVPETGTRENSEGNPFYPEVVDVESVSKHRLLIIERSLKHSMSSESSPLREKWLSFPVTPPNQTHFLSQQSPKSFLNHPDNLSPIRKRAGLPLTATIQKKLKLDPTPEKEDSNILEYHQRLLDSPSIAKNRTKLLVMMPFESSLTKLIDAHLAKSSFANTLSQVQKTVAQRDETISQLQETIADHEERLIEAEQARKESEDRAYTLHEANQLVILVKALAVRTGKKLSSLDNLGNNPEHAASLRFSYAYTLWDEKTWTSDTGLKQKYYTDLKGLASKLDERNDVAHEGVPEFAKLLCSPFFQKHHIGKYEHWKDIFAYCYRDAEGQPLSIEEVSKFKKYDLTRYFPTGKDPRHAASQ
ncbi:MAG: hypothetical protein Q9180_002479 [Flavoplaca navasiana]